MTDAAAQSSRKMLSVRPNASRQLLARKAAQKSAMPLAGDCIESSFPTSACDADFHLTASAEPANEASSAADSPHGLTQPSTSRPGSGTGQMAPMWSDEDEEAFKAMALRRKAAHYRPRGRDVATQVISVGGIKPNSGTVVAVLVELVAERGTVTRAALVDAMASATFAQAKAKPSDAGWCQGYVAGAIRSGFLSAFDGTHSAPSEQEA